MCRYIFKIILLLVMSSFGISQDVYVVNDIYTIEDDSSYSLVVGHASQSPIEYFITLLYMISKFLLASKADS